MSLLLSLALAAATPTPEAEALGLRLARSGTLAALLPLMGAKETDELVAQHPELSEAERAQLREVAAATLKTGADRLLATEGNQYAQALSVEDLRVLVAAAEHPAAGRLRAAMPRVITGTMAAAGSLDFKRDVTAAFCARTGKLCAGRK